VAAAHGEAPEAGAGDRDLRRGRALLQRQVDEPGAVAREQPPKRVIARFYPLQEERLEGRQGGDVSREGERPVGQPEAAQRAAPEELARRGGEPAGDVGGGVLVGAEGADPAARAAGGVPHLDVHLLGVERGGDGDPLVEQFGRRIERVEAEAADRLRQVPEEQRAGHLVVEAGQEVVHAVAEVVLIVRVAVDEVDNRDGQVQATPPAGEEAVAHGLVGRQVGQDAGQRRVAERAQAVAAAIDVALSRADSKAKENWSVRAALRVYAHTAVLMRLTGYLYSAAAAELNRSVGFRLSPFCIFMH
jgi:hypothetical protein